MFKNYKFKFIYNSRIITKKFLLYILLIIIISSLLLIGIKITIYHDNTNIIEDNSSLNLYKENIDTVESTEEIREIEVNNIKEENDSTKDTKLNINEKEKNIFQKFIFLFDPSNKNYYPSKFVPNSFPKGLTPLHLIWQLNSVVKELNAYQLQKIKFYKIIVKIENNTESFYPNESITEFKEDLVVIDALVNNLNSMASNLISEIQAIDPSFFIDLYNLL